MGTQEAVLCHTAPRVPPAGGPVVLWVRSSHIYYGTATFAMLSNLLDNVAVGPGGAEASFPPKTWKVGKLLL